MLLALLQFFSAQFLYLALHLESGSFPRPLSPKEEAAAFEALRAGDAAAREKIIQHNLRLAAHIAKKYYALPGDQDDLISIGTIGLIKAVNTFDSTRPTYSNYKTDRLRWTFDNIQTVCRSHHFKRQCTDCRQYLLHHL